MPQAAPMARKTPRSAPSIVSADMTIVGAITAGGDIQVDGKVEGDIVAESLTVGEKATINGEVLAEEVIVRGIVQGSIKAEKVQLCSGARVQGDILHAALAVETGALFEGNCRHSQDPLGRKSGKPAAESVARMESAPAPDHEESADDGGEEASEPGNAPAAAPAERSAEGAKEENRPQSPGAQASPAARFKPDATGERAAADAGNGRAKSSGNDLGKMSPGRMRAGSEQPSSAANAKPK
ncbi:MAG: polymer-forming cytoskeletal protein [Alphaproteobacteria bacterium]